MADEEREALVNGMRLTAVALSQAGVPFALCGTYAAWARGAPEPDHDVDFVISETDVDRAKVAIEGAGLEIRDPAEDWLFKAYHEGQLVDVLFRMCGEQVSSEMFERADELEVAAVRMPVISATDVISTKMRVLQEHYCDLGRVLPVARALREQVDWDRVRTEIAGNPYAEACQLLLDRLGIAAGGAQGTAA
ncbi:hypothetical protein [Cellulomonas fimi]|uniref:Nucleotidyltransferase family protein n=1 Tax=Cellulomonas fimi TaxID=1708 RepID=A0A7Y0LYS5_CELFI|nr:hypothetical protein [Cellulomonas fimi]NMR20391.1 hypothetical protein [Cellulomonas fimi]